MSIKARKKMDITLVNESCFNYLAELPSGSADLVLIDPPYEVSRETNFQSGEATGRDVDRFRISMDFGDWDACFTGLDKVIEECYRVLRRGGTLICFYDLWKLTTLKEYFERTGFKQLRFIEWLKTNPVPLNSKRNYLTNAREIAVSGVKGGKPTFHSEYDKSVYEYPICHDRGRFHPTQKPLALIEELIEKHSDEGDLVIDCFSGSGTTAVACLHTKRNFSGCELDAGYYRQSMERIAEEQAALGCETTSKDRGASALAETKERRMSAVVTNKVLHEANEGWIEADLELTLGELIDMSVEELNAYAEENICDGDESELFLMNISYTALSCDPDNNTLMIKVVADIAD